MDATQERKAKHAVNTQLAILGRTYHNGLPLHEIDGILALSGFNRLEEGIYCGREGRINEQVGPKTWFTMSWFKMESGRYEVTAYVS